MQHFGGLDIVVSNAGIATSAPIESMALEDWERSLNVNATGHCATGVSDPLVKGPSQPRD